MKKLKKDLQAVNKDLKALTKKTERLVKAVGKLEKSPAKKKGAALTATDQVLKIIKRSKKGVDAPTLIEKTGFEDKKIRNILFRASKQGKIKRADRGAYVAV